MGQLQLLDDEFFQGTMDLTFLGKATEDHTMDLKWYAQSLIGFNESFVRLGRSLFNLEIKVEIVAEEEGSLKANILFAGALLLEV